MTRLFTAGARVTHEDRTEAFYSHGVEHYGTFHGNYLNFGLWENHITDYVAAAEHLLTRVANKIQLGKDSVLLDVACGMGTQDAFWMQQFGCRAIEAVDLTVKHIAIATERNRFPNVGFRVGDACVLPFAAETFTHVTAIEGVVHFNPRERFYREAHRVLMPGGRLGMSDFCLGRAPRTAFEQRVVRVVQWAWHVPRENADTVQTYATKLERAGFTAVDVEVVSDAVVPGYVFEQRRPEIRRQMYGIRGPVIGRLGLIIDWLVDTMYRMQLLAYILVSARKP
jgi:ubiquinone/menaquinone biosynthesis C-methylase UbiE